MLRYLPRWSVSVRPLRRALGCEQLTRIRETLDQAFRVQGGRVEKAFRGGSLDHNLPLLATFLHTPQHSTYPFFEELVTQTLGDLSRPGGEGSFFPVALAGDLLDALKALVPLILSPQASLESLIKLTGVGVELVGKAYPGLNRAERTLFQSLLQTLQDRKETLSPEIRVALDKALLRVRQIEALDSAGRTHAYLEAFGSADYLQSEDQIGLEYSSKWDSLQILFKEKNTTLSLFKLTDTDVVGQIHNLRDFFEQTPLLDSLVVDVPPVLDRKRLVRPDPSEEKMLEYSQTLISLWPYLYRFFGKAELRGFYKSVVFDREFFTEKDDLFYYLFSPHNQALDPYATILAHFMGFGDRTSAPSVHLAGILSEERVIEAVSRVETPRATQLNDLHNAFNLAGALRLLEGAKHTGCEQCGGSFDSSPFYQLMDKMYRAEYEPQKGAHIQARLGLQAVQRVEGVGVAQVAGSYSFDSMLPSLLEIIRQQRMSGLSLDGWKREDHIRDIYSKSRDYTTEAFWEKLALVESVMGTFESTLSQFIDLFQTETNLVKYQQLKQQIGEDKVLSSWNPHYVDTHRESLCPPVNILLPVETDPQENNKRPVYVGNPDSIGFEKKVGQKFEQLQKEKDEKFQKGPDSPKGRKIKPKFQEGPSHSPTSARAAKANQPLPGKRLPPKH